MELEFTKTTAGHLATGNAGKFLLVLNPLEKTWIVKLNNKLVASKLKGFAAVQSKAQEIEDQSEEEEEEEEEETETMPTVKTRTATKVATPIKTATKAVSTPVKATATKAVATKKVKPFPAFEEWVTENVELLPVPKSGIKKAGIEDQNRKTLQGAKLKHGRLRAAYNRENGLTEETPTKASTPTAKGTTEGNKGTPVKRVAKPKAEKLSRDERFGNLWHEWGNEPTPLEYAIAQLANAKSSRDYAVIHGKLHRNSEVAKNSYLSTVERMYSCEKKVWEVSQAENEILPKSLRFEYFNAKGVPAEMIVEPKEGTEVIAGHIMQGYGKLKIGEGVRLPVNLNSKLKK